MMSFNQTSLSKSLVLPSRSAVLMLRISSGSSASRDSSSMALLSLMTIVYVLKGLVTFKTYTCLPAPVERPIANGIVFDVPFPLSTKS